LTPFEIRIDTPPLEERLAPHDPITITVTPVSRNNVATDLSKNLGYLCIVCHEENERGQTIRRRGLEGFEGLKELDK
jgi:hypothetical protein